MGFRCGSVGCAQGCAASGNAACGCVLGSVGSSTGAAGVAGTGAGPVRANEISPRASRGFFASTRRDPSQRRAFF